MTRPKFLAKVPTAFLTGILPIWMPVIRACPVSMVRARTEPLGPRAPVEALGLAMALPLVVLADRRLTNVVDARSSRNRPDEHAAPAMMALGLVTVLTT